MLRLRGRRYISIGEGVAISSHVVIAASRRGPITIGKYVEIGPFVVIISNDHKYSDPDTFIQFQGVSESPIVIGNDVLICAHVTVLRGSTIPDGCVIGACSLVNRHSKLEPYGIYAGNPLRKIRSRRDTSV